MSAVSSTMTSSGHHIDSGLQWNRLKHLVGDYGLIVVFTACLVALSVGTESFLTVGNLINVIRQSSIIGFIALGMTFVMITAGIDLSVGSVAGLGGVLAASLAPANSSAFVLPILAGLGVGLFVGVINAGLIVRGGVLPFLATLAVMAAIRGTTLIYTDGHPVSDLSAPFQWLGTGTLGIIPVPVVIFLVVAFLCDHVLARTRFGRHVYAVGGNPEAARTVGIPVRSIIVIVYLISATLAAFSGIILTARVNGADPLAGTGTSSWPLPPWSSEGPACLVGGFDPRNDSRCFSSRCCAQRPRSAECIVFYQETVQGLILVVAVLLNRWKSD